jgi:hypothetical protein
MPIPPRLRPPPPSVEEFREYMELSRQIEDGLEFRDDVSELLTRWNARAGRTYQPSDFHYHGAISSETFVGEMLLGEPALVPDLTYDELREVLRSMLDGELSEAVESYSLRWLEANLPGANVSDLIHWPNEWFKNETMLHAELTHDQVLAYAMAKSGRHLPDAPADVPMPYPIPPSA